MSIRQRKVTPRESRSRPRLWHDDSSETAAVPGAPPGLGIPRPRTKDKYVTVDERLGGVVGVVAADWPRIDEDGLRFDGTITAAWFDVGALQATVDRFRGHTGELLRPLRIGDSFWVRGFSTSLDTWQDLRDVTINARAMAKAAVAVVAVGAIDQADYVESDRAIIGGGLGGEPPPEPPRSGPATANPVV